MHGQICGDTYDDVIPFARVEKTFTSDDADQLDKAGQTILDLVQKAAGIAEGNSRHALRDGAEAFAPTTLGGTSDRAARSRGHSLPGKSRARRAVAPSCLHRD
jgi:hypothetical protein